MTYHIIDNRLIDILDGEAQGAWYAHEIAEGGMTGATLALKMAGRDVAAYGIGEALRYAASVHQVSGDAWRQQVAAGDYITRLERRIAALRGLIDERLPAQPVPEIVSFDAPPEEPEEPAEITMLRALLDDAQADLRAALTPYRPLIKAAADAGSLDWHEAQVIA